MLDILSGFFLLVHSWYPEECCEEDHCIPVELVQELKDHSTLIKTKEGHILTVSPQIKRLQSHDEDFHLCYNRKGFEISHELVVYCFFVPGSV